MMSRVNPASERRLRALSFDVPAGAWTLWLWTPAPDLQPAVAGLWATSAQTVGFREKVVPRETVELMVNFGGQQVVHRPVGAERFRRAWVSGLQSECIDIESPTAAQLMAASLHPAYAGPLLGVAGCELRDRIVPLSDVISRQAGALADRLEDEPSIPGRFLLFESFLRERLHGRRKAVPTAMRAVSRIVETGGRLTASALQAELGCSARYLETHLAEHVGFSPKQLSRLIRFSRVIERVRSADAVNWSTVALDCGYYDQSHFSRDFRRFTGATPGEFLAHRDPSSQAILVE